MVLGELGRGSIPFDLGERPVLQQNRLAAVSRLGAYMRTPQEERIRPHHSGVMQSLHDFFASGKTAGYVHLPPGAGKTVFASLVIKALGMRSVIISPTTTILEKTGQTVEEFAGVEVANYYSDEKGDISLPVVNTTYQSVEALKRAGLNPLDVQLLFVDESHVGLGEQRHRIYRDFPNAIKIGLTATPYFTPLEGYKQRGLVDPDENWISLFTDCIHKMSLEEGIERGFLSKVDIQLYRTNATVARIPITSAGEYKKGELERQLNTLARNYLTVAMIAGVDKIPGSVTLSFAQMEELMEIHEKIRGKRTAVFGLSIAHVEQLAEYLRNAGIRAETIHSNLSGDVRRERLKQHAEGEVQVLLGVDALRVGWDSPETEVGIYLDHTLSGIVALQELGRILRQSEDTGKERAIAIQMVDRFHRGQAPILFTDLFDPYYVFRGTQLGKLMRERKTGEAKEHPLIAFSGVHIDSILEESKTENLIRHRLQSADAVQIGEIAERLAAEIRERDPNITLWDFYQRMADAFPQHLPAEKQEEALQAMANIDSNVAKAGKNALLFMNLKTVLSAVEKHMDADADKDEFVAAAVTHVYGELDKIHNSSMAAQRVYYLAQGAVYTYIAQRDGVPAAWLRDDVYTTIKAEFDTWLAGHPEEEAIPVLINRVAKATGKRKADIEDYVTMRLFQLGDYELLGVSKSNQAQLRAIERGIQEALGSLSDREAEVLRLKFFRGLNLEEIGERFGVSKARIGQIQETALRTLRHPSRAKLLMRLMDERYDGENPSDRGAGRYWADPARRGSGYVLSAGAAKNGTFLSEEEIPKSFVREFERHADSPDFIRSVWRARVVWTVIEKMADDEKIDSLAIPKEISDALIKADFGSNLKELLYFCFTEAEEFKFFTRYYVGLTAEQREVLDKALKTYASELYQKTEVFALARR